jgi:DNA-binding LytR/AlgR family response regulator
MTQLQVALADDEPLARERLGRLLLDEHCVVKAVLCNGLEVLNWVQANPPVDVLFLDIQMPAFNGLETVAELVNPPPVVFVTAHPEFAVQGYEVSALDFLVKPVFPERVQKTLARIRNNQVPRLSKADLMTIRASLFKVTVKAGSGLLHIDLHTFTHFELEVTHVYACRGAERFLTRWHHLADVERSFPEARLLRIHRNILLRAESVIGTRRTFSGGLRVRVLGGHELMGSASMGRDLRARLEEVSSEAKVLPSASE